jgi:hypothetical protein
LQVEVGYFDLDRNGVTRRSDGCGRAERQGGGDQRGEGLGAHGCGFFGFGACQRHAARRPQAGREGQGGEPIIAR